jgi:hypothetical protein
MGLIRYKVIQTVLLVGIGGKARLCLDTLFLILILVEGGVQGQLTALPRRPNTVSSGRTGLRGLAGGRADGPLQYMHSVKLDPPVRN